MATPGLESDEEDCEGPRVPVELAARIRDLRETIDVGEFHEMYVMVELADDLLGAMRPGSTQVGSGILHGLRAGTETENA